MGSSHSGFGNGPTWTDDVRLNQINTFTKSVVLIPALIASLFGAGEEVEKILEEE